MENYYAILGVSPAASADEIRRAYRILARRYHPDVNPGKTSEEKFKKIAHAYAVLSDPVKRRQFDSESDRARGDAYTKAYDRAHEAYRRQQENVRAADRTARGPRPSPRPEQPREQQHTRPRRKSPLTTDLGSLGTASKRVFDRLRGKLFSTGRDRHESEHSTRISQVSLIEVSVSIFDAIRGVRKTVEISDGKESRKISVTIPPGVRSGSVIRFRRKEDPSEEIVLIIRVAAHHTLQISHRGLTYEVAISVQEAIQGGKIQIPTLDEPVLVSVEPGTQSGTEVRLKDRGIKYRDGTRGDLFVRFMIKVPESPDAVGLKERVEALTPYYAKPVRHGVPRTLFDL